MKKKLKNTVLVVSIIGMIHFFISLLSWGMLFWVACKLSKNGSVECKTFIYSIPAVILFILFIGAFILARRESRFTLQILILAVILLIGAFVYDAVNRNYQFHAENMAGDNHGGTFKYCTWWWYTHY
jgi:hypothetical protein